MKLLSNGHHHLAVRADGCGLSTWRSLAVTRWTEDAALPGGGTFLYLRDDESGRSWSLADAPRVPRDGEPAIGVGDGVDVATARFTRRHAGIESTLDVAVADDRDIELRRVRLVNRSASPRSLTLTSHAEVVLAPAATDSAHPAFSKLFVETGFDADAGVVVATRRPSTSDDTRAFLFHGASIDGRRAPGLSYETDRARFVGRCRSVADPAALDHGDALSGTVGPVLDAIVAVRVPIELAAGASVTVDVFTGIAGTRRDALALAATCVGAADGGDRILAEVGRRREATLRTLGLSPDDATAFDALADALVVASPPLRGDAQAVALARGGQPSLWAFGVSGDVPIVLCRVGDARGLDALRDVCRAQAWWKAHGLDSEVMVVADDAWLDRARAGIASGPAPDTVDRRNGIFLRAASGVDAAAQTFLSAAARIVVDGSVGLATLAERVRAAPVTHAVAAPPEATAGGSAAERHADLADPATLLDWNGHGGFAPDSASYVVQVTAASPTPAPWTQVLANPGFGTIVSESGSASTWRGNAHEFRLTPWSNDAVGDPNSEAIYLRDEDSGAVWSPTLLPTRSPGVFEARHGFGASTFLHRSDGIESTLEVFVDATEPVKVQWLTLRNRSRRTRRLSVTGYVEWVLGDERPRTLMHVVTGRDDATGAVTARNAWNVDFAERCAFFAVDVGGDRARRAWDRSVCADRGDFIGHGGTRAVPAAMRVERLSGRVGAALDPCAAVRVPVELAPGAEAHVFVRLGAGDDAAHASALAARWRSVDEVRASLAGVREAWRNRLSAVTVRTPDRRVDTLANGWLLYQVLASRFWGRTAFYQSSGAYGFRDQLQDAMALVHAEPALVREHLLRSAARQFPEGDVQHWWHEPSGKGIRTRCSDDYLWLPFVAARYVEVTGDRGVLDATVPFLDGAALKPGQDSDYAQPAASAQTATLHGHCVRAIGHGLRFGAHGLPLMAGGDWNDGMNLVGARGQGESVWLAFFLVAVLRRYAPVARAVGDAAFASRCEEEAQALAARADASAWDGGWYRRAWFDDGTPLGSADRTECRIDSIAQSWSAISGAAPGERAACAMASVDRLLVHADAGLVQLLDPPFDTSTPSPGYIQGYVPGVRENGGQYTHAAVWAALAFAELGDAERAWAVFDLIEPTHHGASADAIGTYAVEPYVVAGDVYARPPHTGRGGWTWYTGSAGWMLQLVVEALLGLERRGTALRLKPLVPAAWPGFDLTYRFGASTWTIACRRAGERDAAGATVDGVASPDGSIALVDDGRPHAATVTFPATRGHACNSE